MLRLSSVEGQNDFLTDGVRLTSTVGAEFYSGYVHFIKPILKPYCKLFIVVDRRLNQSKSIHTEDIQHYSIKLRQWLTSMTSALHIIITCPKSICI